MPMYMKVPLVITASVAGMLGAVILAGYIALEMLHWMVLNPPW